MTARYAIYFAPPADSALARFGAAWLGRDAETGARPARPAVEGFSDERLACITETPRGYGFHATLAPPFRVAEGCTRGMLDEALADFARDRQPFRAPPLRLATLDDFLALMLSSESEAMQALEDDIIHAFHRFRAPPTPAEHIRRQAGTHTPRQEELLRQWGYPFVLDEFRFHMTLTCELDAPERRSLREALERLTAPLCDEPLAVDGIALFEQEARGAPLRLARRYLFGTLVES
ncbi:MAG: DUF1045 domain-containing protein [Rhodospirillales bacterium]|nr:DUF1045 domain-containing protein [Rhodospirillales bacterium]